MNSDTQSLGDQQEMGTQGESAEPAEAIEALDAQAIATEEPAVQAAVTGTGVAADGSQIDQASAEAFIAEKRIGERIKRLRLKKSMGLVELGRHTGLSASFLSQLETGRVVPTLRNLARVAIVFGKDLSYFFDAEPQAMFRVHRKRERMRLPQSGVEDPTYYFESLGYMVPDRQLDPYYAEFLPQKKGAEVRPHVHPGFEFLYLLEGQLEIRHADKVHILETGDGVYFDASTPHAYLCHGTVPAIVIIVTMHQQSLQQSPALTRVVGTVGTSGRATTKAGSGANTPGMAAAMPSVTNGGGAIQRSMTAGQMATQAQAIKRRERPSA